MMSKENNSNKTDHLLKYSRSRFVTHLPKAYFYTASHGWARKVAENKYRVGITKFATRMLGEIVEHDFEVKLEDQIEVGQIIGWVEGFKAASDLYCIGNGKLISVNKAASQKPDLIASDPYEQGWLYEFEGELDSAAMDIDGYVSHLNLAIDAVQGKVDMTGDDC